MIKNWKRKEYEIIIYYLRLPSAEFAVERVKMRVARGGHNVPEIDIRRRFDRSWLNFQTIYRPLANFWVVYDTSGCRPALMDESEGNE